MNQRVKCFYALVIFILAEAIQIVVSSILIILSGYLSATNSNVNGISQLDLSQNMRYLISASSVLVCGIVFFALYIMETRGYKKERLITRSSVKMIISLILLGLGCQLAVSGTMSMLQKILVNLFEEYANQIDSLHQGNAWVVFLLLAVIAPITEELIFRGVILHHTNRYISFLGANLIQATLFGIYHFNIVQGIYAAILGFLLGLVYHKFKTIIAPIILHMTVNISSYLILVFPERLSSYFVMIFLGIGVIVIMIKSLKLYRIIE